MPLAAGTAIGPYTIVAPLGSGGMGEVYRARDARLGRDVAIKVLPSSFAADADRLRRFEQEARATSALNHPNILVVYDIGTHEGSSYVVSELLEGETLRGRIDGTPLPQRKVVDYAAQIARGLAAAHEKGIVHRDLKPDNVFVTRDGRVKILDFGIAKLTTGTPDVEAETELRSHGGPMTGAGTVLGTVGYMSPEQVRGRPVDHRSDIFSFGVVLYEMLTGRRAFQGDSAVETMNAILKEDPPPMRPVAGTAPPALERIVLHCLEKNPEERFQSARDIAFDLESLTGTSTELAPLAGAAARPRWWRRLAAAALLAAGGAGLFYAGRAAAPEPSQPSFEPLTFRRGTVFNARFAPDGQMVVYSARWEGGPLDLYSTQAGSPESRSLERSAQLHAVSPKGELALVRFVPGTGNVLARAPLGGGAPRDVVERVRSADWGPDGESIAAIRVEGGRERIEFPIGRVLYEGNGWLSDVRVSPAGDRVAFMEHPVAIDNRGDVAVVDLQGTKTVLSAGWEDAGGLAWTPGGDEIWFTASGGGTDRSLHAVTLAGVTRALLESPGGLILKDVARDGRVLLAHGNFRPTIVARAPGETSERELTWLDFSWLVDLSADGRQILFGEQGVAGGPGYAVYLRGTDGTPAVRLGKGDAHSLSPDGKWALAADLEKDQLVILPTGTGQPRTIDRHSIQAYSWAGWFPDGKRIVFAGFEKGKGFRMYAQDPEGGVPQPITPEGVALRENTISPDGRVLAAPFQGTLKLFPTGGGEPRGVTGAEPGDAPIRWSGDGRLLYVRRENLPVQIVSIDVATGKRTLLHQLAPSDLVGVGAIVDIRLTPDGTSYAYGYSRSLYSLYEVTGLR